MILQTRFAMQFIIFLGIVSHFSGTDSYDDSIFCVANSVRSKWLRGLRVTYSLSAWCSLAMF